MQGRRLGAAALTLVAVVSIGIAATAPGPNGHGAPPAIWRYPVAVLAAIAFATGVHTAATGKWRPRSTFGAPALVVLVALATAPTFDYTWHDPSAFYGVLGLGALPAAIGAAAKTGERRLAAALATLVPVLGLAAGLAHTTWPVARVAAIHVALTLPGTIAGYALTARA